MVFGIGVILLVLHVEDCGAQRPVERDSVDRPFMGDFFIGLTRDTKERIAIGNENVYLMNLRGNKQRRLP